MELWRRGIIIKKKKIWEEWEKGRYIEHVGILGRLSSPPHIGSGARKFEWRIQTHMRLLLCRCYKYSMYMRYDIYSMTGYGYSTDRHIHALCIRCMHHMANHTNIFKYSHEAIRMKRLQSRSNEDIKYEGEKNLTGRQHQLLTYPVLWLFNSTLYSSWKIASSWKNLCKRGDRFNHLPVCSTRKSC